MNYEQDVLKIIALPVQQRSNGVDCGVFAIAFISYVLSHHKSPIGAKFNTSKMRSHLLHFLLEDKVAEFPRIEHAIRKCFEKAIKVMYLQLSNAVEKIE